MRHYWILLVLVVMGSCTQHTMKREFNPKHQKINSQKTGNSFSTSQATSKQSTTHQALQIEKLGHSVSGVKTMGKGTFELPLKDCPKRANLYMVSVFIASKNHADKGYLAMLDHKGNIGIGVDFSWGTIYRHENGNAFSLGVNDQIILSILIDQNSRSYALLAQNNQKEEVWQTGKQPFLHPTFKTPSKLQFALDGSFTIQDIRVREV